MAPSLLDLNAPEDPAAVSLGPRPLLTRAHMTALRVLLVLYMPTMLLMMAMNVRSVGTVVFRLSSQHPWFAVTFGILVMTASLTFLLLIGLDLHHYFKSHLGPRPPSFWLWVILLLNVAGVVAYYLRVIEPEQRRLGAAAPGA
jgi:hypothetical protein